MARTNWKETEATVFTCGVQDHAASGKVYVPGTGPSDYLITFSYEIDGEWYSGEFNSNTPRERGEKFTLRYDPRHPENNDVSLTDRQNLWTNIMIGAICVIALIIWIWHDQIHGH